MKSFPVTQARIRSRIGRMAGFQSGFSLLEMLMVLLAVVGVLAALGMPAYQRASVQFEINNTARQFAQQAESARVMAQAHGVVVALCPVAVSDLSAANPTCLNQASGRAWAAWVWRNEATQVVLFPEVRCRKKCWFRPVVRVVWGLMVLGNWLMGFQIKPLT